MKHWAMRLWLVVLLLLTLLSPASADPKRVVVVLLPGTSLTQWRTANAPTLHRLMAGGALAVMNTRTARLPNDHARETPESALLTLNAGSRAAAPSGALGKANWPDLVSDNQRLGYDVRLGNLTDALSAAGVSVYAGGGPQAALAAASGTGQVRSASASLSPGLTVWDAGPDPAAADALLGRFAGDIQRGGGRLVVLSPSASDADYRSGRRLTPILVWGPGISAGLLYSPSTHRAGLVTNTDFAPSIAAEFGVTRDGFPSRPFGQAWTPEAAPNAVDTVAGLDAEAVRQAHSLAILPYVALALALAIAVGTVLALRGKLPALWPLAMAALLTALLLAATPTEVLTGFLLLTAAAWPGARRFGAQAVLSLLFGVVAAALIGDMLTGSHLMHRSLLGYSAIEGARYYGIGNEAMGLLIGSLLVLASWLWSPSRALQGAILGGLGLVCLLLGAPGTGAKAGGVLVSLLSFGALLLMLRGGKLSVRTMLGLGLGAAAVLAGAVGLDLMLSHGHSHLGEAARRISVGGWGEAQSIIARKLAVEVRLAWHSTWAAPLWAGLVCVLLTRQSRTATDRAMRGAGLTAVAACVALNDAGVVAGALCVLPLWCALVVSRADRKTPPVRQSGQGAQSGLLY